MASFKLLVVEIVILSLLPPSLQGYTKDELEQLSALSNQLHAMEEGNDMIPSDSSEDSSMTTEPSDQIEIPIFRFDLSKGIIDIGPTESGHKVDFFDKCMRDVMRGKFGNGKYHFSEYIFCKGWFGKKFSDEVELETVAHESIEINALDSDEQIKIGDPERVDSNEELMKKFRNHDLNMQVSREKDQTNQEKGVDYQEQDYDFK
ncbi:uncharacterized protein LOC129569509 [Sitodiplosis mosellana]|uniref:uncharacterized protein LOC129569509 n=1 Tax=Sitodiplosis mosellana TaxID=263140 RepID=UPI002443A861|nr:uncharacterized protein LOC129569509 [Sitodiplosis mosellana]